MPGTLARWTHPVLVTVHVYDITQPILRSRDVMQQRCGLLPNYFGTSCVVTTTRVLLVHRLNGRSRPIGPTLTRQQTLTLTLTLTLNPNLSLFFHRNYADRNRQ